MNIRMIAPVSVLITVAATAQGADLQVMHEYDSNPYRLSNDAPDSRVMHASFYHQEVMKLADRDEIQLSAEIEHDKYLDVENADTSFARLRGRFVNRMRLGGRSASLLFTGDLGTRRAPYIDQRTGKPLATSRGDNIQDRFSYNFAKPSVEFTYRWSGKFSTGLFTAIERRDYVNDYEALGIEALDYTEFTLQPTLRFKTESTYSRAFVYSRLRQYDARMIDDENGRNVANTQLELSLRGFGISHQREFSPKWKAEAYLSGYTITDNGIGFSNQDALSLQLSSDYRIDDYRSMDVAAKCTRRENSFVRLEEYIDDTEFGRERSGCQLNAGYEQPVLQENKRLKWRIEAHHNFEDNSETVRSYDQWGLSMGLSYQW